MIKIAICDDNPVQNEITVDMVNEFCDRNNRVVEIRTFESGVELLKYVEKGNRFDLYLLDMIMPEKSGLDVAKNLRDMGSRDKIVFLTATSQMALQAYEVRAFNYLIKPLEYDKLASVVNFTMDEHTGGDNETIEIRTHEGMRRIELVNLLYVDIANRALCYHMKDDEQIDGISLRGTFKVAIEDILDTGRFALCGAGMAVNLGQIDSMNRSCVTMTGGEIVYPPKSALGKLYEEWQKYWKTRH